MQHTAAAQAVLHQYTGYLPVIEVDIVRPFDGQSFALLLRQVCRQRAVGDYRCEHVQSELSGGCHLGQPQQVGEQQVLAALRLPTVACLSASGGLIASIQQRYILIKTGCILRLFAAQQALHQAVGAIGRCYVHY